MASSSSSSSKMKKNKGNNKFYDALNKFLADSSTRPEDKAVLLNYLNERSAFSTPTELVPIDEIKLRLDIVKDIQAYMKRQYRNWSVTTTTQAIFMAIPLETLKGLKEVSTRKSLKDIVDQTHSLIWMCKVPLFLIPGQLTG